MIIAIIKQPDWTILKFTKVQWIQLILPVLTFCQWVSWRYREGQEELNCHLAGLHGCDSGGSEHCPAWWSGVHLYFVWTVEKTGGFLDYETWHILLPWRLE